MEQPRMVKLSKRMSKALRHDPGRVGLVLDPAGWVEVETFLTAMGISRADLNEVVAGNDKQRFAVVTGADGIPRIRASQGHSVQVDLGLTPEEPPDPLYHGTSAKAIASIMANGLNRGKRHHVHLSPDLDTARRVAHRRPGAAAILIVATRDMAANGHTFYRSANGVWLTDEVPPAYLSV